MIEKPLEPIVQTDIKSVNQPRTLLQRYNINIDHLDFDYIKTTQNVRELEKIVLILRSGQEGYFPDLTKCAEDRLKAISPASKILRTENAVRTRDCMDTEEWRTVTDEIEKWENEMKSYDNKLRKNNNSGIEEQLNYPPIRQTKSAIETAIDGRKSSGANKNRIQVCDYTKWDKYDADAEITKMDLHEERNRDLQIMKINREQNKLIEELDTDEKVPVQLSEVEKEVHANRFKDRGNEYFRANEFKEAIAEYTRSINMKPTAAAFNNRAMAYLKLNFNKKALSDCDECLKIDSLNIKAYLRKGQALLNDGRQHDAFHLYEIVLSIDPENSTAQAHINDLKKQLPDLVKPQKFRMKIDEDVAEPPPFNSPEKPSQIVEPKQEEEKPVKDIDFAKLIIPNKIVRNRLPEAIKALGNFKTETSKKMREEAKKRTDHANRNISIMPRNENKICKPLIQEI